jgi:predicted RNA-binding Zn ribbon-like protein
MEMRHSRVDRRQGLEPAFPRLLGERVCLDFANSIEEPLGDTPQEFLVDYAGLVRWGRHAGLLADAQVATLLAQARRHPAAAIETWRRALALRAAIDRVFRAIARGGTPAAADLTTVRDSFLRALASADLAPTGDRFAWVWDERRPDLDWPLWPVARSAVELLLGGDPRRIKECPEPEGCSWLFYDQSKNASRRWCSMEGCGSLVKMRRYRARRRSVQPVAG